MDVKKLKYVQYNYIPNNTNVIDTEVISVRLVPYEETTPQKMPAFYPHLVTFFNHYLPGCFNNFVSEYAEEKYILILQKNSVLIGSTLLINNPSLSKIVALAVAEEYTNRKLGSLLYALSCHNLFHRDSGTIHLESYKRTVRFYKKLQMQHLKKYDYSISKEEFERAYLTFSFLQNFTIIEERPDNGYFSNNNNDSGYGSDDGLIFPME